MDFTKLWTETGSTLEKVVLAIAIGAVIAGFIMLYNKRAAGKLPRELIKRGAHNESTALTLAELGLKPHSAGTTSLKNPDSGLRRYVEVVGRDGALTGEELAKARLYVPEDRKYAAEVRYDAKGTNVATAIVAVIAIGVAAYLCIKYIPQLLNFRLFK